MDFWVWAVDSRPVVSYFLGMYPLLAHTKTWMLAALVAAQAPEPYAPSPEFKENSPMSYYEAKTDVLAHLPYIHQAREEFGVSAEKYSDALILAIIHRETGGTGRPDAHTPGTSFWTHIQFGRLYLADAMAQDPSLEGLTPETVNGELVTPVRVFLAYMEKYDWVHQYQPSWVAAMHKCGVSEMIKVRKLKNLGRIRDVEEGLEVIDVSNDSEYVGAWGKLFTSYAIWVRHANERVGEDKRSKRYQGGFDGFQRASWQREKEPSSGVEEAD